MCVSSRRQGADLLLRPWDSNCQPISAQFTWVMLEARCYSTTNTLVFRLLMHHNLSLPDWQCQSGSKSYNHPVAEPTMPGLPANPTHPTSHLSPPTQKPHLIWFTPFAQATLSVWPGAIAPNCSIPHWGYGIGPLNYWPLGLLCYSCSIVAEVDKLLSCGPVLIHSLGKLIFYDKLIKHFK